MDCDFVQHDVMVQHSYNHDIFGKYPRDASTPALPGIVRRINLDKVTLHKDYLSFMVGKLLYFMKKVGPVCANAPCRELSQHFENPGRRGPLECC